MAFWNSGFGASMNTQPAPVALILDRESFTLEDLLDEDEILQECNSRDADERLIAFLSQTDTVRKLAEYIVRTVPPAEPGLTGDAKDHDDRIRIKFPFIASEIFQSTIPALHAELLRWDDDDNDCLEVLFSLLESDASPIDAVLAGYFRSVIMSIVHVDYAKLVQFVQAHPQTIDNIIKHIGSTSILEVLIVLGWDDAGPAEDGYDGMGGPGVGPGGVGAGDEPQGDRSDWMADMGVVEKLVAKLASSEGADDNHSASYALVDVVAKCASHQSIKLLERLQAEATVEQILSHVISGNEHSFCEGLGVLIALVHKHANEEFDLERAMREERADRLGAAAASEQHMQHMQQQQQQQHPPAAAVSVIDAATAAGDGTSGEGFPNAAAATADEASAASGATTAEGAEAALEGGGATPPAAADEDAQLMYKAFSAEEPYFVKALTKRLPEFEKVLFGALAATWVEEAQPPKAAADASASLDEDEAAAAAPAATADSPAPAGAEGQSADAIAKADADGAIASSGSSESESASTSTGTADVAAAATVVSASALLEASASSASSSASGDKSQQQITKTSSSSSSSSSRKPLPLGARRLKVVEMLVALLRTHYPEVMRVVASLRVIPECLSLFFEYKWNNILHGYVEHIVQMIISGPSEELKRCLFERGELVDRVLRARREHDAHVAERNHFRAGFMGHLTRMCNTIVGTRENDEILAILTDRDDWRRFVDGPLNSENSRLNVVLGGVRPEHMIDAAGMDIQLNLPSLAGLVGGAGGGGGGEYQQQDGGSQMQHSVGGPQDASWDSDSDEDEDDDEGAWSSGVYFSSEQSQQLEPRRVGDVQQQPGQVAAGGAAAGGAQQQQQQQQQEHGAYQQAKYSDWGADFPPANQWDTPEMQQQAAPGDADADAAAAAAAAAAASRPRGNSRDLAWDDEEEDDFHDDWRESLSDGSPGVLSPANASHHNAAADGNGGAGGIQVPPQVAAAAAAAGGALGVDPELEARSGARKPSPNASASELMAAASRVLEEEDGDDFDAVFPPGEPGVVVVQPEVDAEAPSGGLAAPDSVEHAEGTVQVDPSA